MTADASGAVQGAAQFQQAMTRVQQSAMKAQASIKKTLIDPNTGMAMWVDASAEAAKGNKELAGAIDQVGKATKRSEPAISGFGRGLLSSTLHIGGLVTASRLLGAVVGATVVTAFMEGTKGAQEYADALDRLATITPNANAAADAFTAANLSTHTPASQVAGAFNELLRMGNFTEKTFNDYAKFVPQLATYFDDAGVDAKMATRQIIDMGKAIDWPKDQLGKLFKMVAGASRQNEMSLDLLMPELTADAAQIFERYGYQTEKFIATAAGLRAAGYDTKTFAMAMERLLYDFSNNDVRMAQQKWEALLATIKSGNTTEALELLEKLNVRGTTANEFINAVQKGLLTPKAMSGQAGDYVKDELEFLASELPDTIIEGMQLFLKKLRHALSLTWLDDNLIDSLGAEREQGAAPRTFTGVDAAIEKYRYLQDVMKQSGIAYTKLEQSYILGNTDAWDYFIALTDGANGLSDIPKSGNVFNTLPGGGPNAPKGTEYLDWLLKEMGIQQNSYVKDTGSAERRAQSSIPKGFQVAAGGMATDYSGSIAARAVAEAQDAQEKITLASDRATDEQIKNSNLVLAYAYKTYQGTARTADVNLSFVKWKSWDAFAGMKSNAEGAAEETARSFWTLNTVFGETQVEITELQKVFDDFGISGDQLFDNLYTGVKRVAMEIAKSWGWETVEEDVALMAESITEILQFLGDNLGKYWELLLSDTEYTIESISEAGLSSVKKLAGTAIMSLSEMFATGKFKLADLWKKIWTSLLDIAIQAVIKIITTQSLLLTTMAAIEAGMAILTGNFGKLGAIAVVVAGVAATVAGATALIYGVGKAADWLDSELAKGNEEEPRLAQPSLAGVSSMPLSAYSPEMASSSSVVNVSMAGANIYGKIDDNSARKIGEGLTTSLAFRGVVPLAYS